MFWTATKANKPLLLFKPLLVVVNFTVQVSPRTYMYHHTSLQLSYSMVVDILLQVRVRVRVKVRVRIRVSSSSFLPHNI